MTHSHVINTVSSLFTFSIDSRVISDLASFVRIYLYPYIQRYEKKQQQILHISFVNKKNIQQIH